MAATVRQPRKKQILGDELSLLGADHILQRPIVVVTDSLSENKYCRPINPPAIIDESLWGQKVVQASVLASTMTPRSPLAETRKRGQKAVMKAIENRHGMNHSEGCLQIKGYSVFCCTRGLVLIGVCA